MTTRRPAEVFPPGDFLREELVERGWTQADLAEIVGRPQRLVNEIVMGKRGITPETARGLAEAFGTSAEFWMNLDSAWQLWKGKGEGGGGAIARRAKLYELAPIKDMLRRGWIETTSDVDQLEDRLREFFEVSNLNDGIKFQNHAAWKSTSYSSVTPAQNAWLFWSRKVVRKVQVGSFSEMGLRGAMASLKELRSSPEDVEHVPAVLAAAGVRLAVVEPLPGSRVDGACFWLHDSPVVVLSMRFDRIDNFWFTLFHELAHAGDRHAGVTLDIDLDKNQFDSRRPERERAADAFACESLVSTESLGQFIASTRPFYSMSKIQAFAQAHRVHPGIVVGQLQHRGEISYSKFRSLLVSVRPRLVRTAPADGWQTTRPV